jgi:predicted nucleic acid-binding protein
LIVVDASVVVDLLLATPPFADAIARHRHLGAGDLHAPHLLDTEVAQVFRRFVRRRELGVERAERALDRLEQLPMTRYAHTPFLRRAFELRDNLTLYDALYLVLAEVLEAPLLTRDRALADAAGHRAEVLVVTAES